MSEHLDTDGLADLAAGRAEAALEAHASHCGECRLRLAELEAGFVRVSAGLSALPLPPVPAGLDARISSALAAERRPAVARSAATVLPLRPSQRRASWLPVAGGLAAAAVLVFSVVFLSGGGKPHGSTAIESASGADLRTSSTGLDYGQSSTLLATELPALLRGGAVADSRVGVKAAAGGTGAGPAAATPDAQYGPQAPLATGSQLNARDGSPVPSSPDPLARLRTTPGLASCIASLSDVNQVLLPLALDYAAYKGEPALVVILPSPKSSKVDIYVVGAGCSQRDAKLLLFSRLPKPA